MKDEVYRVAERYGVAVTLVAASWMRTPPSAAITLKVVAEASMPPTTGSSRMSVRAIW